MYEEEKKVLENWNTYCKFTYSTALILQTHLWDFDVSRQRTLTLQSLGDKSPMYSHQ